MAPRCALATVELMIPAFRLNGQCTAEGDSIIPRATVETSTGKGAIWVRYYHSTPFALGGSMSKSFVGVNPTVIIGLGGTGKDVIMRVRRLIVEHYGSLDNLPVVSFLSI